MSSDSAAIGLLLSGGLDSSILLGHLLASGRRVRPLYIRSNLVWQAPELRHAECFLAAVACSRLDPLVMLDLPLADLYGDFWAVTGQGTPDAQSADESVYLPGRNALLAIKALLWCQLHAIESLAIAVLQTSPFADAKAPFFEEFETTLAHATGQRVRLEYPFARLTKSAVMRLGRDLPLQHTFSCIAPQGDVHCGQCNKCAERQAAFRSCELPDPTVYASPAVRRAAFDHQEP